MLDGLSNIPAAALKEIKRRIKKKVDADYRVVAWLKAGGFSVKLDDTFDSIYLHALADYHLNWDPFELVRILKADHVQAAYYKKIFEEKKEHNGLAEALRKEGELLPDIRQKFDSVYEVEKQLEQFEELLRQYREQPKEESIKEIIQKLEGIYSFLIDDLQQRVQQPNAHVVPKELNELPNPPIEFIGRAFDLSSTVELLQGGNQVLLLNGIGGIGKTTLAKKYLHSQYDNYNYIAWISVLQEGSEKKEGFQSAAEALGGDPDLFENLGIPFDLEQNAQVRTQQILKALKQLPGKNLLVIDNAGFSLKEIRSQLPKPPTWHILVTSRKEIPGLYQKQIDELPPDQALMLFYAYYPQGHTVEDEIKSLIAYIGYHTLTIELLAKTCRNNLSANPSHLLKKLEEKQFEEISQKAWSEHSDRDIEVYGYLLAIFDSTELEPKEREILTQLSVLPSEEYTWELLLSVFQIEKEKEKVFDEALRGLMKKGWVIGGDSLKVHQMIQEVIRNKFPPTEESCMDIIQGVRGLLSIDQNKDNPIEKFPLIVYGEAILSHIEGGGKEINTLKNNLATIYKALGRYEQAAQLLEAALESDRTNFGEQHHTVAIRRSNLATVYQDLGRYEQAAQLLEVALESDRTNFGERHPNVAIRSSNLALVYQALGRYKQAAQLLEAALESDRTNFGEQHPTVAISRSNLALVYKDLGRYEQAAQLLEVALESDRTNFGEQHPTVARSHSNLATIYKALGRYEQAAQLLEAALESDRINFGEQHPTVATSRSNLAVVYQDLGRYEQAAQLLESALESARTNFGEQHPNVATSRSNLAVVYQDLGRYEQAAQLLEAALESDRINFGEQHPNVAIRSSNLALVYQALGRYEQAAQLLEAALESDRTNFGEQHPTVARSRSNLALVYQALGRYEQAAQLLEAALESDRTNFGEQHPNVAIRRSNLALVYKALGRYEQAAQLLEAALESDRTNFGEQHPNVAIRRSNLATVYKDLGRYEQAAQLLESALESARTNFGEQHPNVATSRSNLAVVYQDLGRYEQAAQLLEAALESARTNFGEQHPNVAIRELQPGFSLPGSGAL